MQVEPPSESAGEPRRGGSGVGAQVPRHVRSRPSQWRRGAAIVALQARPLVVGATPARVCVYLTLCVCVLCVSECIRLSLSLSCCENRQAGGRAKRVAVAQILRERRR